MTYNNFQTPIRICHYMVSMLEKSEYSTILEPTPGQGNLAKILADTATVICPLDFFTLEKQRFDAIVMNPPFSPMDVGYRILFECMDMADEIIALMPWLTLINSQKRTEIIMRFGLKSITHLPRNIFKGSRVQCCILHLIKGYDQQTFFKNYQTQYELIEDC